ncbi:MAG: hypothetical protein OEZ58_09755 [Gammaproteobacteria bacterium]|nr:hypothetical protein [Gammaproteobacteria bacterium]MDH5729263.1 hypothetical protein [Gammaproteobacteria bacterium]
MITIELSTKWEVQNTNLIRQRPSLSSTFDKQEMEELYELIAPTDQIIFTREQSWFEKIRNLYVDRINIMKQPGMLMEPDVFQRFCQEDQARLKIQFSKAIPQHKCFSTRFTKFPMNLREYEMPSDKGYIHIVEHYVQVDPFSVILISIGTMGNKKKQLLEEFESILRSMSVDIRYAE